MSLNFILDNNITTKTIPSPWTNLFVNSINSNLPIENTDASKIQGRDVADVDPANTEVLTWSSSTMQWEPAPGGGGGGAPVRQSGTKDLYWSQVSGDNNNNGETVGAPVQTWNRLIEVAQQFNYDTIRINLYGGENYDTLLAAKTIDNISVASEYEYTVRSVLDFTGFLAGEIEINGNPTTTQSSTATSIDTWEPYTGFSSIEFSEYTFPTLATPVNDNTVLRITDPSLDVYNQYSFLDSSSTQTQVFTYNIDYGQDVQTYPSILSDIGTSATFTNSEAINIGLRSKCPVVFKDCNVEYISNIYSVPLSLFGCKLAYINVGLSYSNNTFIRGCKCDDECGAADYAFTRALLSPPQNGAEFILEDCVLGSLSISYSYVRASRTYFGYISPSFSTLKLTDCVIGESSQSVLKNVKFFGNRIGFENALLKCIDKSDVYIGLSTGPNTLTKMEIEEGSSVYFKSNSLNVGTLSRMFITESSKLQFDDVDIINDQINTTNIFSVTSNSELYIGGGCTITPQDVSNHIIPIFDIRSGSKMELHTSLNLLSTDTTLNNCIFDVRGGSELCVYSPQTLGFSGTNPITRLQQGSSLYSLNTITNATVAGNDIVRQGGVISAFAYDTGYNTITDLNKIVQITL